MKSRDIEKLSQLDRIEYYSNINYNLNKLLLVFVAGFGVIILSSMSVLLFVSFKEFKFAINCLGVIVILDIILCITLIVDYFRTKKITKKFKERMK